MFNIYGNKIGQEIEVLLLITQANSGSLDKVTNFNQLPYNMVLGPVKKMFVSGFPTDLNKKLITKK